MNNLLVKQNKTFSKFVKIHNHRTLKFYQISFIIQTIKIIEKNLKLLNQREKSLKI